MVVFKSHNFLSSRAINHLSSSMVRNLQHLFHFSLGLALGSSGSKAGGGFFKLSFTRRDTVLTNCLFQEVQEHHIFQSGKVPRFNLLNSVFNAQRQQWLQLF